MGDWAQTLVDVEVGDDAAPELGQRLASWLIERRIVAPTLTDCVLGAESGHPPGENYGLAVGNPSVEPPRWGSNGVDIDVRRQVYWGSDLEAVICPRCDFREAMTPREQSRWDTAFDDAINEWCGGGAGLVSCLGCGADNGLNEWDWGYPWAFGALGVTFWNWDHLADDFVAEIAELLGHRLVRSSYKL
jgi:hypothetical protein